jgi:CRISPR-associated endonuclease/helicase Cas3
MHRIEFLSKFWAHSGTSGDTGDWQGLPEHLRAVASLAAEKAGPLGLARSAHLAGLLHDLGKYDPRVQRRIGGADIAAEHSTAGGAILLRETAPRERIAAEVLAYCILGHHAGLPDRMNGAESSLDRRVEAYADALDPSWRDEIAIDLAGVETELLARTAPQTRAFDLSVAVRMLFSCLVEADFLDTEAFYARLEARDVDRAWPALQDRLPEFSAAFDVHMASLPQEGELNVLRRRVLDHVCAGAALPPGLFTLTVPTGGGKTLASLGFALDHAARHGHRRIIYAIPFTSIIDQTAETFCKVIGKEAVLEHHSAIDEEQDRGREGRDKLRLAMENWAAPVVVTTNVQLFESLFAARPSRARKLHNIAGSVLILDEVQTLPRPLLRPCLAMLDALARHWGCSIVLCTATQPAVDERLKGGLALAGRELAPDPADLARRLRRARIVNGGEMDDDALVAALTGERQALVIVNSRAHALGLWRATQAAGLEGLVHLTTRQYAAHRQEILADVRARLKAGAPCRVVATSLVEAGVDVDFPRVWRAKAGLDAIVQAAGRCNREGRRGLEESLVTIFSNAAWPAPREVRALIEDMGRMWEVHRDDLLSPAAIEAYFREVYFRMADRLDGQRILPRLERLSRQGTDFAFRAVAADFRMIDNVLVPVVIPLGAGAVEVGRLGVAAIPSGVLARALQRHVVLVPPQARQKLLANGKAHFAHPELRGDQFAVLDDLGLYHQDSGLWWEDAEYLATEAAIV